MKDETHFIPIIEFICLASKSYSFTTRNNESHRKGKGVKKSILETDISHKDYKNIIKDNIEKSKQQIILKSYHHQLYTIQQDKIALSNFDDNIFRIDENNGLPYGHYALRNCL